MLSPHASSSSLPSRLQAEGLRLRLQPIFEQTLRGLEVHACEGLCQGALGSPFENASDLFDQARREGVEPEVDHLCINSLLSALPALEEHGLLPEDSRLSLNVHRKTLETGYDFFDPFFRTLRQLDIPPERIILEVTEHPEIGGSAELARNLTFFRDLGGSLAIDDLGQGQSNLRRVLDLSPDYLKLDRYVVQGVAHDSRRQAIVETCALLADRTGACLIAEGVETKADLDTLGELNVRHFQGYLLARPQEVQQDIPFPAPIRVQSIHTHASRYSLLEGAPS